MLTPKLRLFFYVVLFAVIGSVAGIGSHFLFHTESLLWTTILFAGYSAWFFGFLGGTLHLMKASS